MGDNCEDRVLVLLTPLLPGTIAFPGISKPRLGGDNAEPFTYPGDRKTCRVADSHIIRNFLVYVKLGDDIE